MGWSRFSMFHQQSAFSSIWGEKLIGVWCLVPESQRWNIKPRRNLLDRELQSWAAFTSDLPRPDVSKGKDFLKWIPSKEGIFTTKSARNILRGHRAPVLSHGESVFNNLWQASIPKRCKFFIWTLFHKKLNTSDRLQKKLSGTALNPNICFMCRRSTESIDHLFVHCSWASYLRYKFNLAAGLQAPCPLSIDHLCAEAFAYKAKSQRDILCRNFFVAYTWYIWKERNARVFQGTSCSIYQIWDDSISLAALWSSNSKVFSCYDAASIAINWDAFL